MPDIKRNPVFENSVLVSIVLKRPGVSRSVDEDSYALGKPIGLTEGDLPAGELLAADVDKDSVSLAKTLLASPEFKAVGRYDMGVIRAYFWRFALPSFKRKGLALLPLKTVDEADRMWNETFLPARAALVEAALEAYPRIKRADKARLRDLYKEDDYPTPAALRTLFSAKIEYLESGVPGKLKAVSADAYRRAMAEAQKDAGLLRERLMQLVRAEFMAYVTDMTTRLKPEQGKAKRITTPFLENLKGFVAAFEARNIAEDAVVAPYIKQVKRLVDGLDAADLRTEGAVRDQIAAQFQGVKASLAKLVELKPVRKFRKEV